MNIIIIKSSIILNNNYINGTRTQYVIKRTLFLESSILKRHIYYKNNVITLLGTYGRVV